MDDLLNALAEGWGWKIGKPAELVATNAFGNAIVRSEDGTYFRVMPEELRCDAIARSAPELELKRGEPEFAADWEMKPMIARAAKALGPLAEGQVYYLVIPGVLGGDYGEMNMQKLSLRELFVHSGDLARQIDHLPDGTKFELVVEPPSTEPGSS